LREDIDLTDRTRYAPIFGAVLRKIFRASSRVMSFGNRKLVMTVIIRTFLRGIVLDRAKHAARRPTVLTVGEVRRLLAAMRGIDGEAILDNNANLDEDVKNRLAG